jgi:hypothetical protein
VWGWKKPIFYGKMKKMAEFYEEKAKSRSDTKYLLRGEKTDLKNY